MIEVVILNQEIEKQRQDTADDHKFWKSFLYFFELYYPNNAIGGTGNATISHLVPLILNPQGIAVTDPFALTTTPTVDGGLFLEENGIYSRSIRIEGHTGFRPKSTKGYINLATSNIVRTSRPSFELRGKDTTEAISGHRHFQFLQDRIFRMYGDLKRDPATARNTYLVFHNLKDDEHWLVAPVKFEMQRNAKDSRVSYHYAIELLAYDLGTAGLTRFVEEDVVLPGADAEAKDVEDIKNALGGLNAFISDVKAIAADIDKALSTVTGAVISVVAFVQNIIDAANAVADFVSGLADTIAMTVKSVADLIRGLDAIIERIASLPNKIANTIVQSFRQCGDALDSLGVHKDRFRSSTQQRIAKLNALRELGTSTSAAALQDAETNPPNSLQGMSKLGTKPLPGDNQRAKSSRSRRATTQAYASAYSYVMRETDTLHSLAARLLGDTKEWRVIAALNGLVPPYVSEAQLPGTVRAGDSVLIPSKLSGQTGSNVGANLEDPLEEQLLKRDFLLVPVTGTREQYDLTVDPASRGTDVSVVKGIENLQQALRTRMITERGSNALYPNLGHERIVGVGFPAADNEIVRFRLRAAILADARIDSVGALRFNNTAAFDVVDVELDAAVKGFSRSVTARAAITL